MYLWGHAVVFAITRTMGQTQQTSSGVVETDYIYFYNLSFYYNIVPK